MPPRQRRTKPLHPAKDPDYRPASTKCAFIYKVKHFFVEPELIPEHYPYDRGVIHSKGCMIPYYEFRGDGDPANDVGIPGDIWLDGTSRVAVLYFRAKTTWIAVRGPDLVQQVLHAHPCLPGRVLWCTRKAAVWCDPKTANRHWTATRKEYGTEFGEWALVDMLEDVLSSGEEGFITPGTESNGSTAGAIVLTTSADGSKGPLAASTTTTHSQNDADDCDPLLEWVSDSEVAEHAPILTGLPNGRYRRSPNERPGESSSSSRPIFRPALGGPSDAFNALGIYHSEPDDDDNDPSRFQSPDEIDSFAGIDPRNGIIEGVSSTGTRSVDVSMDATRPSPAAAAAAAAAADPSPTTPFREPPSVRESNSDPQPSPDKVADGASSPGDTRQSHLHTAMSGRRRTFASLRSSASASLRLLTAQAVSRRQSGLGVHNTQPDVHNTQSSVVTQDSAGGIDRADPAVSLPAIQDNDPNTDGTGHDDPMGDLDVTMLADPPVAAPAAAGAALSEPSRQPSSLTVPSTSTSEPPSGDFPLAPGRVVQTGMCVSTGSVLNDIPLTRPREDHGRLEAQQAQIQQLLQDVRHLQAEVALLKNANRQLRVKKQQSVDDTAAWMSDSEAKLPVEMQEIAGPMIIGVKRAIQLCMLCLFFVFFLPRRS